MKNSKFFLTTLFAAAAMSATAHAAGEIISINFGNAGNAITEGMTGTAGLATYENSGVQTAVGAAGWANVNEKAQQTVDLKNYDGTLIAGASVTARSDFPTWGPSVADGTVIRSLQGSYYDLSNQSLGSWNVEIESTFLVCDVYVYLSGDGKQYGAVSVNGTFYKGDATNGSVEGSGAWGNRNYSEDLVLGTNALKVSGLSGTLSLTNELSTVNRATLSGIQVVNTYAGTAYTGTLSGDTNWSNVSFNSAWANSQSTVSSSGEITTTNGAYADFTLSADATLTIDSAVTTDAIYVSGEGKTLTLAKGENGSLTLSGPATLRANAGATLAFDSSGITLGENIAGITLAGTGTVKLLNSDATVVYDTTFSNASTFGGTISFASAVSLVTDSTTIFSIGKREFAGGISGHSLGIKDSATVTISGGESSFTGEASVSGTHGGNSILVCGSSVLNIEDGTSNLTSSIGTWGGGTINQSGGVLNTNAIRLHDSGTVSGTDTYNLSGGVVNVSATTTSNWTDAGILIGHWGDGKGVLNVSESGVLNAENTWAVVSWDSSGEFNISGGEVNIKGITLQGHGTNVAAVTVSGGRLNLGSNGLMTGNTGNGTKSYNINGGTLGALDSWTASAPLNIGGSVTIDTTKRVVSSAGASSAAAGDDSEATIAFGNLAFADAGALTLEGAGTVILNGPIIGVTVEDSVAKITLSSGTLQFGDNFVYALTGTNDSISGKSLQIVAVNGGTIDGTLDESDFTWNGSALSPRIQVEFKDGVATFTGSAYNLFWKGGDSGTWDTTTATIFGKDSPTGEDTVFATGDNVTFDKTATITVASPLTAGRVTLTEGTVTLSSGAEGAKLSVRDSITVEDGATLKLGAQKIISGKVFVNAGGTFDVNGNSDSFSSDGGEVVLAGGFLTNSGNAVGIGSRQLHSLTLTANSTIGGEKEFGIVGSGHGATTANLGGFELEKVGSGTLLLANTTLNNGTLKISDGSISDSGKSFTIALDATLKLAGGSMNVTGTFTNNGTLVFAANTAYAGTLAGNGGLKVESGTLTWTGERDGYGTVTIASGAVLDASSENARLFATSKWHNKANGITVGSGAELKVASLAYGGTLGNLSHYANNRVLDGGKITITGTGAQQAFKVTEKGGTLEATNAESSLTFSVDASGNTNVIVLDGALSIGGAGDITVSRANSTAISGSGSLEKFGDGTLTLSSGSDYSGGTTISAGTLVAGNASALGNGAVKISGGQLSIAEGVTLSQTAFTIVLGDAYKTSAENVIAAIAGAGSLATGTTFTLEFAEGVQISEVSYRIFAEGFSQASDAWTFSTDALNLGEEWTSSYANGVFTISAAKFDPQNLTWNGDADGAGTWGIGLSEVWTLDVSTPAKFRDGDSVTFAKAGANVTVSGTVAPADMTVNESVTFTGDSYTIAPTGTVTVAAEKTLTLDGTGTLSGVIANSGTIAVDSGATLLSASASTTLGTITGSGRVELPNTTVSDGTTFRDALTWTGTVAFTNAPSAIKLSNYGNQDSVVELNGFSGYWNDLNGGTIASDLILNGEIVLTNAWGSGKLTVSGNISGTGTFTFSKNLGQAFVFDGSVTLSSMAFSAGGGSKTFNGNVDLDLLSSNAGTVVFSGSSENATVSVDQLNLGAGAAAKFSSTSSLYSSAGTRVSVGKISLANGATLETVGQGYSFDSVSLADDASATMRLADSSGVTTQTVTIKKLSGSNATLSLVSTVKMNTAKSAVYTLGASDTEVTGDDFSGKIVVNNTTNGTRKSALVIENQNIAKNAVISFAESSHHMGLGVNAERVMIAGLESVSGKSISVFSGPQTGDSFASDGTPRTLEINVAEGASYAYNGEILANVALVKSGAGTQTLAGASTAFDGGVTLNAGTLKIGNADALGTGTITLAGGVLAGADDVAAMELKDKTVAVSGVASVQNISFAGGTWTFTDKLDANFAGVELTNVTFDSTATTTLDIDVAGLVEGKEFVLFTGYTGSDDVFALSGEGGIRVTGGNVLFRVDGFALFWDPSVTGTDKIWSATSFNGKSYTGDFESFDFAAKSDAAPEEAEIRGEVTAQELSFDGDYSVRGSNSAKLTFGTGTDGAGAVTGTAKVAVAEGKTVVLDKTVATAGAIEKTGAGKFVLAADAASTVSSVAIAGGTFGLSVTDDAATSDVESTTFAGALSGNGIFEKSGSGTLTLSGGNTYSGGTTISAGKLVAANASALGTGAEVVVANEAELELAFDGEFSKSISGAGSVSVNATGTLTLSGANEYSGGTTIASGTLKIEDASALGSGAVTNNSTLELAFGGEFSKSISGTGSVSVNTTGTLTLSGENKYSGGTVVSAGTLVATSASALGTGAVSNNSKLELAFDGEISNAISGTGSVSVNTTGTVKLSGKLSGSGSTVVSAGTLELNTAEDYALNSVISGNGTLKKSGTGKVALAAGTNVANIDLAGGALSNVKIGNNGVAKLNVSGAETTLEALTMDGGELTVNASGAVVDGATLSGGTLDVSEQSLLLSGNVNLSGGTIVLGKKDAASLIVAGTTTVSDATIFNLSDFAVSDYPTHTNPNTLGETASVVYKVFDVTTNAGATLSGWENLDKDNFTIGTGTALSDRATLEFNKNGSLTLTNEIYSLTWKGTAGTWMVGNGDSWTNDNANKASDTAYMNSDRVTFAGDATVALGSNVAPTSLSVKSGADLTIEASESYKITGTGTVSVGENASLTLNSAHDYTGATQLANGATLQLNLAANDSAQFKSAVSVDSGAKAAFAVNTEALGADSVTSLETVVSEGVVLPSEGLIFRKAGVGTLSVSSKLSNYDENARIQVAGGVLLVNGIDAVGKANLEMFGGAKLCLEISEGEVETLENSLIGSGEDKENGVSASVLEKSGTGTLTIEKSNRNFNGNVLVSSGTLVLADSGALGDYRKASVITVSDDGVLDLGFSGTYAKDFVGSGKIRATSTAVTVFNGDGSGFTGTFAVNGGVVRALNATALGSGIIELSAGKEVQFDVKEGNVNSFKGIFKGEGTVSVSGNLVMNTESNSEEFSGAIRVAENASLEVGNAGGLGNAKATVLLATNSELILQSGELSAKLSGTGSFRKVGDKELVLSNSGNDFSGTLGIDKGSVSAKSFAALGNVSQVSILEKAELRIAMQNGEEVSFDKEIRGKGSVFVSGKGILNWTSPKTFDGALSFSQTEVNTEKHFDIVWGSVNLTDGAKWNAKGGFSVSESAKIRLSAGAGAGIAARNVGTGSTGTQLVCGGFSANANAAGTVEFNAISVAPTADGALISFDVEVPKDAEEARIVLTNDATVTLNNVSVEVVLGEDIDEPADLTEIAFIEKNGENVSGDITQATVLFADGTTREYLYDARTGELTLEPISDEMNLAYAAMVAMPTELFNQDVQSLHRRMEQRRFDTRSNKDLWEFFAQAQSMQVENGDDRADSATFDFSTYGTLVGGDVRLGESTLFGLALAYDHGTADIHDSQGEITADDYRVTAYAGTVFGNYCFAEAGAHFGFASYEIERRGDYGNNEGETDGWSAGAFFSTGCLIPTMADGLFLTPYASVAYLHTAVEKFEETGTQSMAADDMEADSLRVRVGLGVSYAFELGEVPTRFGLDVAYSHELLDDELDTDIGADLDDDSGDIDYTRTITEKTVAESAVSVGTSLDFTLSENTGLYLGYSADIGMNSDVAHRANIGFRFTY